MWLELQIFGFRALWSPYFLTFLILIGVAYYVLTGPKRHWFGKVDRPSQKQHLLFYGALAVVYVIKGSPIDLLSHIMLGAHMIQMALLYLLVPIMFIRGLPVWMWRWMLALPVIKPVVHFFTLPLVALALFNTTFPIYHIPAVFDFSKASQPAHIVITVGLFILAFFMWWPIVTPLKEHDTMQPLLKMGYLVLSAFLISIACALIIFSNDPMYNAFSSTGAWVQSLSLCVPGDVLTGLQDALSGPEMFSPMSALEDQQFGGIIMMTLQQIIYGSVISWIFFNWFTKKNLQVDPMPVNLPYYKE